MEILKTKFLTVLMGGVVSFALLSFDSAQAQSTTKIQAPAAASNTSRMVKKKSAVRKASQFLYVNGYYTSFADQILANVSGSKVKARSVFQGFGLGMDYTRYWGRYLYGWNLNLLSGTVDIQKVQGISYPRKSFLGVHTGPEMGYRVNADMDLSYSLGVLFRDIETIGESFALSNQINIKFRFTKKLTFFQNFGNYGTAKAYSYSIGLRWLL